MIEAFDQSWKISQEGTVGGHWGLYDDERRAKFSWTGPVAESPYGRTIASLALLAGVLSALIGKPHRARAGLASGAAAALFVAVGARQWRYLIDGNVNWIDWAVMLTICAICWAAPDHVNV
jgi:hypothetical protein